MSTDVQRICEALALVHELWACSIDIGLAVWLLEAETGLAMLGPLVVTILAVSILLVIASRIATAQKEWLAGIQVRVNVTAKVLQTMKGVKMLGLTSTLSDIIQRLRTAEITSSLRVRRLMASGIICGNTTDIFAPGIAFTGFVIMARYNGQTLTASSAYTTLSLISLLASPVKVLINFAVPQLMGAVGCFDRIQDYLLSASRHDHRLLMPTSQEHTHTKIHKIAIDNTNTEPDGIELKDVTRRKPSIASLGVNPPLLQVVGCTLAWSDTGRPVINDASFEVSPGLTMLVGPIGSGKSSLLKGLLGEIPSSKGYVYTDSRQVAFVDQTPWIRHGTLRENILGMSIFDHKFYSSVVHACALDQDFESLAQGDHTPVGSAGAALSGGQKLRVVRRASWYLKLKSDLKQALAKAVYSRRHILILDDVFSGLDAGSEERIFSRLLGRRGLLRDFGTTVLLATHAAHRLSYADKIIVLDAKGSVCEQGSFSKLMKAGGYVSSLAARHTIEADVKQKEMVTLTKNAESSDPAQANAADDLNRPVGDWSIYKYYFAAAGYSNTALLLGLLASFAFFLQFPGIVDPCRTLSTTPTTEND
jgi:ATP-binding cassette subfamily C (CFTR/MRP) protein 1